MILNELYQLYIQREQALEQTCNATHSGFSIGTLSPAKRAECDRQSERFRRLDRQIVEELKKLDGPAQLHGLTLWLTSDRLNFVPIDPSTGFPPGMSTNERSIFGTRVLYQYPGRPFPYADKARRPGPVPGTVRRPARA